MDIFSAAILLAIIMDLLGSIPLFHPPPSRYPQARRLQIIARELVFAYLVLVLFLVAGQTILNYLGWSNRHWASLAGWCCSLSRCGWSFPRPMAFGGERWRRSHSSSPWPCRCSPVHPRCPPCCSSRSRRRTWFAALSLAWSFSAAILLASGVLFALLGPRALRALVRLTGMLLIMISVQMLMDGVAAYIAALPSR